MRRTGALLLLCVVLSLAWSVAWGLVPPPEPELGPPPPEAGQPEGPPCPSPNPSTLTVAGSIGEALMGNDNDTVTLPNKVVTLGQAQSDGDFFYVEEADRTTGVRIKSSFPAVAGRLISITGTLGTVDGERCVTPTSTPTQPETGGNEVNPLWMGNAALRCGPLNGNTPGISATSHLPYTVGLLVSTWGGVAHVPPNYFYYINDGSNQTGDYTNGIRILGTLPTTNPAIVTGISCIYDSKPAIIPIHAEAADREWIEARPGVIAGDWSLLSLPGITWDSPIGIFSDTIPALYDEMLTGNLWLWDPTPPQSFDDSSDDYSWVYNSYSPETPDPFAHLFWGEGYWVHCVSAGTLRYFGFLQSCQATDLFYPMPDPVREVGGDDCYSLGNYLVGYPYLYGQSLASCKVTDGYQTLTFEEAVEADWMAEQAYWWDNNASPSARKTLALSGGDSVEFLPWHAYWFRSYKPGIALVIPHVTHVPPTPIVDVDAYVASSTALHFTWSLPSQAYIEKCEYRITGPGGAVVLDWQEPSPDRRATDITVSGLSLTGGQTYYISVKVWDCSGGVSAVGTSNGVTIDLTPPVLSITSPPGDEIHKASGATTIQLAGTATDALSGLSYVKIGFTQTGVITPPQQWYDLTPSSGTWTYDWAGPQDKRIWVWAVDQVGLSTIIHRDVTVWTANVIYVKLGSSGNGLSWATAKGTVHEGLNAASSGYEVWVAQGTYYDNISIPSEVRLCGGFSTDDDFREQADPRNNETILDGGNGSTPTVTIEADSVGIDGFTIQHGSSLGAGIKCLGDSITIVNNIIRDNNAGIYSGGGIFTSGDHLTVAGNVIIGNQGNGGGGVFIAGWQETETDVSLLNNTIIGNTTLYAGYGGGIYLQGGTPTLCNNLVAYNVGGGIEKLDAVPTFSHNMVCGNSPHDYSWNITFEEGYFPPSALRVQYLDWGDWHIDWGSGCRDAGDNSVALPIDVDIDRQPRRNGTIDIGADEATDRYRYRLTLASVRCAVFDTTAQIIAHVTEWPDWDSTDAGLEVDFSVDAGEIPYITRNGEVIDLDPDTQAAYGTTDQYGDIRLFITRSDVGEINITGCMPQCDVKQIALSNLIFLDPAAPVDVVFVLSISQSMQWHEASWNSDYPSIDASVQRFARSIAASIPNVDVRFGAAVFHSDFPEGYQRVLRDYAGVDDFCHWVAVRGWDYRFDHASYLALSAAADDLEAEKILHPANRRFLVYVTDSDLGNSGATMDQRRSLAQRLDELTGTTGGGVFVSQWEDPECIGWWCIRDFYGLYFVADWRYRSLAVNGGFDAVNWVPYTEYADEPRYHFNNLSARVLHGH